MVGTSVWDYVFIRTSIFLLHLVAPLSVVCSLGGWLVRLPFHIPRVLELWLALEAAFYLLVYLPRQAYLQTAATHPNGSMMRQRRRSRHELQPIRVDVKLFRSNTAKPVKLP